VRLRNRPLLVGGLDAELYVPRPDLEKALHAALRDDRNVLLVGERGSGKTTLLRKVIADAPEREIKIIDAALASTVHDLIRLIGRELGQPPTDSEPSDNPVDLLDALAKLPRNEGVVIVIDGSLDADVAYIFFGRLRDQLWQMPYTWIVSATPQEAGALRTPPADAFWSLVLELGPMGDDEIYKLFERALEGEELARLKRDAGGEWPISATPRHVVRWAQDILEGRAPTRNQELLTRAERLGRQAAMALYELQALDRPAAAGDPELLDRLGWTRPNAARWLSRMEHAGILRSFPGTAQGQGRPPKLYEPVKSL
jgi:hypothetical protein